MGVGLVKKKEWDQKNADEECRSFVRREFIRNMMKLVLFHLFGFDLKYYDRDRNRISDYPINVF
ncbi:MAG: hypothetical protein WKI04_15590 [Ferruginibacter sp.]